MDTLLLLAVAVVFHQSFQFSDRYLGEKMRGEQACASEAPQAAVLDYPGLSLERVGLEGESRFWIVYHATEGHEGAPISVEAEEDATFRKPSQWVNEKGEPVAFLRDDDDDSHPDKAFLFWSDKEAPKIVDLREDVWRARNGCEFWQKPTAHFQKWALDVHDWTPSMAREHRWIAFLNNLSEIHIEKSADESIRKLKGLPSRVSERSASELFELVSETVAQQEFEPNSSDDEYWAQSQKTAYTVLSWVGLRVTKAGNGERGARVHPEGYTQPLILPSYSAPSLLIESTESVRPVVLDVLLFNGWIPQDSWEKRVDFGT